MQFYRYDADVHNDIYFHAQVKTVKKKKVKKTDVPLNEKVFGAMPRADLQKATDEEFEMALQDRVMEETKEKKNAVEAYVYDMRNKVSSSLQMKLLMFCGFLMSR